MTMLASTDDFEAITGQTLDDAGLARVTRLLELASDAVLASAHGQTIVEATTTEYAYQWEGVFYLPQRPVSAVSAVVIDGTTVDPAGYRFVAGGIGRPAKLIRRYTQSGYVFDTHWGSLYDAEFTWPGTGREALVTYTHGWDPVPGQIVAAVVAIANARMTADTQALTASTLGSYSESYVTSDDSTSLGLPVDAQKVIDRLCKVSSPISVPISS